MKEDFFLLHRWGRAEKTDDIRALDSLVDELGDDTRDDEHVSVSVRRSDGWCLSLFVSGLVVFENVEDLSIEPRHLRVPRDEGRQLVRLLAQGQITALEVRQWAPGNGDTRMSSGAQ